MKPVRKALVVVNGIEVERMVREPKPLRVLETIKSQRKMLWSGIVKAFGHEHTVYGQSYSIVSPPVGWEDDNG